MIVVNDRDVILQAATVRLNAISTNFITFASSATGFIVNGTTVTPTTITITFTNYGSLVGNPTISYFGITTGTVTNINSRVTQVVIAAANMTADTCNITATLNFLGTTYTSVASISGSITQPTPVGSLSVSVEGLKLRISWPRNPEVDVVGYEVRAADTNWGIDSLYLYNGSPTTCTVDPGTLNIAKTYYVRAYDTSKLYSASSTTTTYTVVVPPAPTGLLAVFSASSATTSTATLTWNNTLPPFGFKQYRVRITLPNTSFTDYIVNTPNLVVTTSWVGTATAVVYVTDILGNESLGSTSYPIVKNAPNTVATPISIATVGSKLLLNWNDNTQTSLPIIGYEVRTADVNWGDGTTHVWKGLVSECQVSPGNLNLAVSYYVKAIDSDKVYSTSTVATNYTRTAPPSISSVGTSYSVSSVGQASVTFSWTRPVGETFAIKLYRITLTKPGSIIVTSDIYSNDWTTPADWVGSATLTIQVYDILDVPSTTFSQTVTKVDAASPTLPIITVNGGGIDITWTPAVAGSLPIGGYQLTTSSTAPSTNPYIYKGNASSISLPSVSANNTWYLFSYDTAGKYCTTPLTITRLFTGPTAPTSMGAKFILNSALFTWGPPATSEFAIDRYELTLTAFGMTTISTKQYSTSWEVPVGWSNTLATLTIVPVDIAGFSYSGAANTVTLNNSLPTAPSVPVLTPIETSLDIDWADNVQLATQLSTTSYEIISSGISIWRGSSSKAQVPLIGKPAGTAITYNLYAYDSNDKPSAATVFNYTPTSPTNINLSTFIATFGTSLTDASLTLSWVGVSTLYGLDYYEVTYDAITVKVSSTSLSIFPLPSGWVGSKTFTVKTVDLLGNKSTGTALALTKNLPAAVPSYSAQVIDNNVMLYWALPTRTTLPISAIRVKKGTSWAGGTPVGDKSGTFTTIFEQIGGTFTYWLAAVDTDKQEGPPVSFPVSVSQPPDFIFNGALVSTLTGTLNNAKVDTGSIVLPIDTAVQYGAHFTNIRVLTMSVVAGGTGYAIGDTFKLNTGTVNGTDYAIGQVLTVTGSTVTSITFTHGGSYTVAPTITAGATSAIVGGGTGLTITVTTGGNWTTPNAQISAGFPTYIQPTLISGYYEEVFDFGTTLSSSQITLTMAGTTISGSPILSTSISYSLDNISYSVIYSSSSLFATNFRYVKVRVSVSQNDIDKGLYAINNIGVRLDSKIINWSGSTLCVSSDVDGTLANFGKEFVDITSIGITPAGTTAAIPVYDFKDVVLVGTYSITTNVCTITTSVAHGFSANALGQQVRLSFNTGSGINGIYAVTSVSSTTVFTVALVATNSTGTLSAYSQGMRIYLFDANGTRIPSGAVTWSLRGY